MCLAAGVPEQLNHEKASRDGHLDVDDTIVVERRGSIALVTLNRPERLNALTAQMTVHYAQTLTALDAEPATRVIVVTGAGRGFCSGADTSLLSGAPEDLQAYVANQSLEQLPTVALTLGTPVITAINGPCAGIGFLVAICADFRFVAAEATLSTTFARLGLVAEYGIAYVLPRLVGLPAATDLLLTGRTIDGREAADIGLAQLVSDPVASALALAEELIAHSSPSSIAVMKDQLLQAQQHDLSAAVDASLVHMAAAFAWPDLEEALQARRDKRPPDFAPRR